MTMSPAERTAGESGHILALSDRDAFAQLATQGRLRGQNVELRFLPIHDLQRQRLTTFFCTPVFSVQDAPIIYGYGAFQNLGAQELPFVDRAILAHAVKFARRLAGAGTVAAIGTSVNFDTLASPEGRQLYQRALRAAGVSDYPFLVLSIENLPEGFSPPRLEEVIAAVRSHVKRIFVHLPDLQVSLLHSGHLGIAGLTLSLPPNVTRVAAMGAAKWLLKECEAQGAHSLIDNIESAATLELMELAGIRFGAGSVFGGREFRGDADPADVEAYMAEATHETEIDDTGADLRPDRPGKAQAERT